MFLFPISEAEQMLMKLSDEYRPRKRRSSSRSSPRKRTLSGRSMSDMSDLDPDAEKDDDTLSHSAEKLTINPMEVSGEGASNGHLVNGNTLLNNRGDSHR